MHRKPSPRYSDYERRLIEKEKEKKRRKGERKRRVNSDHYEYSKEQRLNAERQKTHIRSARCKYTPEEKEALLRDFLLCDAPFLSAANPEAWIQFKTVFGVHLREFTQSDKPHFMTFTLSQNVMTVEDAKTFDLRRIKSWVIQLLRGCDFVAIIEIAPYTNYQQGTKASPMLSFHVHSVIVGSPEKRLRQIERNVNERFSSFVPGCPAADMRPIFDLTDLIPYLMKGSLGEYRVWPEKTDSIDPLTGEITKVATGKMWQMSVPFAGPSTQMAVRSVMRLHHIDKMVFAGGERGNLAFRGMKDDALRSLSASRRVGRQHKFGGRLPVPQKPSPTGSIWTRDCAYQLGLDPLRMHSKRPWKVKQPTPEWLALMHDWEWSKIANKRRLSDSGKRTKG